MLKNDFYFLPVIAVIFVVAGCSGEKRPPDLPKLYPVTLTITMDGQPLEDALVNLYTEDQSISKWTVGSTTNAEGKAVIVTHGQFRGAPEGKFKVCVRKVELEGEQQILENSQSGLVVDSPGVGTGMPKTIEHVDPKFGSRATTTLEIEIIPQGKKMTEITLNVHGP